MAKERMRMYFFRGPQAWAPIFKKRFPERGDFADWIRGLVTDSRVMRASRGDNSKRGNGRSK